MPYIKKDERPQYDTLVKEIVDALFRSSGPIPNMGHVNYVLSSIIWELFKASPRYHNANGLMGVLECVKSEFYRRKVADLENQKILENGDI